MCLTAGRRFPGVLVLPDNGVREIGVDLAYREKLPLATLDRRLGVALVGKGDIAGAVREFQEAVR